MDTHSWNLIWSWAKANGIAAFLGAAAVKLWDWAIKKWNHRLSPMERLFLVLAVENGGSFKWNENIEGGAPLLGYRLAYFKMEGQFIEPALSHEEFPDQGETSALIAKGYLEIADNGCQRRLTADGFRKARQLRASFEKRGITAIKRIPSEYLGEVRDYYLAIPWWRLYRRWSMLKVVIESSQTFEKRKP